MQDKGRVDDVGGPDGNRRRGDVVADGGCSRLVRLVGEAREGGRGIYGRRDVVAGEGEIVVADDERTAEEALDGRRPCLGLRALGGGG